jgi:outer membrane receptor for ferrienterochelin and colicins
MKIIGCLALLLCYANVVRAQATPPGEEELGHLEALLGESVVTTASRSAELASTAPSTVYTITAEELRTFGIRTIDEALSYLGLGVYMSSVRDYSTGIDVGAQGVLLRDAGKHMLALLDGHVMNSQAHGGISINEAFGVPFETIDHIEMMLGAGSVVYGSNAMLLVVNVVTRRARDYQGVHVISELGLAAPHNADTVVSSQGRYGLRYRLGASGATKFAEDGELLVAAEWLDDHSNTYGMGPYSGAAAEWLEIRDGERAWGGLTQHRMLAPSAFLSARYKGFRLMLQANHYRRGMPLVGVFSSPDSREVQHAYRFDLSHAIDLTPHFTLTSRLYGDRQGFAESSSWVGIDSCASDATSCWFRRAATASWIGLEEQATFDWLLDNKLTTSFGFDVRFRSIETDPADYRTAADGPAVPGYTAPVERNGGVLGALFVQQMWKPVQPLTINVGARLDADSDFGARVSPRAAVTLMPTASTSIRASYSEAFRGPTRYELEDSDFLYRIRPASLEPETVRVAELELQQRLPLITFAVRGFASFYRRFIITRDATSEEIDDAFATGQLHPGADRFYVVVNDNYAAITSFGVSPWLALRLAPGLQAGASFNYAHSRMGGWPLMVIPKMFGNLRISWQPVPGGVTIAAAAIITGNRYVTSVESPTKQTLGPQLDLKATVSGPTGIPRLLFRAALTYVHNPYLPYTPVLPEVQAPGEAPLRFPVISRLQGFLGLQYDIDGSD